MDKTTDMILLQSLSRKFGDNIAVNNISLTVKKGEIFSFLGMNGAGKTTTLRMMVGILKPSSGSIAIGGIDLANYPEQAKSMIGYIPDRPYLYGRLTAREFLSFVASLYDVPQEQAEEAIVRFLKHYGLTSVQHRLIDSFSHGMKQRLATCAALLHDPDILIVDEPMVGLDPHGAKLLKDSFLDYSDRGITIFLSTHSLNVAEEISDRIAIIHRGEIISVGSTDEIKSQTGEMSIENAFLKLTGCTFVENDDANNSSLA